MVSNQSSDYKLVDQIVNWVLTHLLAPSFIFKSNDTGGNNSFDGTKVPMNKNLFIAVSRLISLDKNEISFENIAKESHISKNQIINEYKTLKMLKVIYDEINKALHHRAGTQLYSIIISFLIISIFAFSLTGKVEYLFIFAFLLSPILLFYGIIFKFINKNILFSDKILYNDLEQTDEIFKSTYGVEAIYEDIWDKNSVLVENIVNVFNLSKNSQQAFSAIYNYLIWEGKIIYAQSYTTFSNDLVGTIEFSIFDNKYSVTYSSNLWEFVEDRFNDYPTIKNLDNSDPLDNSVEVSLNSTNALFEHLKHLLELMEASNNSEFKVENFGITDGSDEAIPFEEWFDLIRRD